MYGGVHCSGTVYESYACAHSPRPLPHALVQLLPCCANGLHDFFPLERARWEGRVQREWLGQEHVAPADHITAGGWGGVSGPRCQCPANPPPLHLQVRLLLLQLEGCKHSSGAERVSTQKCKQGGRAATARYHAASEATQPDAAGMQHGLAWDLAACWRHPANDSGARTSSRLAWLNHM
jgi:hypothetical protein